MVFGLVLLVGIALAGGAVYLAKDRNTGEKVAVKKISKKYTNEDEFYREM